MQNRRNKPQSNNCQNVILAIVQISFYTLSEAVHPRASLFQRKWMRSSESQEKSPGKFQILGFPPETRELEWKL